MRFACLGIASSTTFALRVNFNSKNPSCVHNVDDCNSLNGNCCANQEMCGVQECFQCINNAALSTLKLWKTLIFLAKSIIQKHSDIFFGRETSVDNSNNFCDDEYTFYGQIEELKLWCDPVKGQVKGLSARHGPKPGESKYAWSMVHGSSNGETEDEKWLLWGHNISEVIYFMSK